MKTHNKLFKTSDKETHLKEVTHVLPVYRETKISENTFEFTLDVVPSTGLDTPLCFYRTILC